MYYDDEGNDIDPDFIDDYNDWMLHTEGVFVDEGTGERIDQDHPDYEEYRQHYLDY